MEKYIKAVEKYRDLIFKAERYIWQHPETGYREYGTSKYMQKIFEELGYELTLAGDIPGFYTVLDTGRPGPMVLIFGELDSVICPEHPECNPETGAVHACGHNAQCAALVGIAAALKEPGITDDMCGRIMLCAVPAEELIEMDYRSELKKDGKITFFGGKQEFIVRGYFDDVDVAFMVHTLDKNTVRKGAVGLIAKQITYKGRAAHAGGAPWDGVNAMYAANCGLNAVNALRETFHEDDIIRFHPIITNGGVMVNGIPGEAKIDSYVRGATFDAINYENKKINRALTGAALSIGSNIDIVDIPGYAPLCNDRNMMHLSKEASDAILPDVDFTIDDSIWPASTDMGDISAVIPSVHPYVAGNTGLCHGADFQITNPEQACVNSAKLQLAMLYLLLKDNAERTYKIKAEHKPEFTIPEYVEYMNSLYSSGDRIEYTEDRAIVKF